MNIKATKSIVLTLVGCMLNNVFLEYIIELDPGAGHLITFCQFLFIALRGFIFTSKFGTVKPKILLKDYMTLVVFFFTTSVVNNWAFPFNIPVPLHMIFRSTCSDCDLNKDNKLHDELSQDHFFWWLVGIFLLTGALLLSAGMGIFQEQLYKKHGKHPEEALYYTGITDMFVYLFNYPICEAVRSPMNFENMSIDFEHIYAMYILGNSCTYNSAM
ncbi:hypothetical protein JTB14_006789 [Gonioctena quinquepunctata]|nr:hypothetical protein JTB14_006789 [Gonioctena quinquepunctata]